MAPNTTTSTLQVCRDCGGGAPIDAHFCPQCTKILSLGRHGSYFEFLGVPRKLNLEAGDLESRFRTLSRQFHPDYFYNATPAERRASLDRASYLNDAYRTLRQPVSRIDYLLSIEGMHAQTAKPGGTGRASDAAAVPPALLEEVFSLNEELDEIRELRGDGAPESEWRARLEQAREPIDARRREHEAELEALAAKWDRLVDERAGDSQRGPVLQALRERMLERNYINNLLAGIEREIA